MFRHALALALALIATPALADFSGPAAPAITVPVASVATLRAGNWPNVPSITLQGWTAPGDDGGGVFLPVPGCVSPTGSTLTDDGGTVFVSNDGQCWRRNNIVSPVPAQWFGVIADGYDTTLDGAITSGTNHFCSTFYTFTVADEGKPLTVDPAGGVPPWVDTVATPDGSNAHCAFTTDNSPISYPGTIKATQVTYNGLPPLGTGLNTAGSGWEPSNGGFGDCATAQGGMFTVAAIACVQATGLVNYTINAPGTGYAVNQVLTINDNAAVDTHTNQKAPIQVSIDTVNGGGGVTGSHILNPGAFKAKSSCAGDCNPTTFLATTGGTGTGFTITLLSNDASFGWQLATFTGGNKGTYSSLVGVNLQNVTVIGNGCTARCSGATLYFAFSVPEWWIGTDRTANLVAWVTYMNSVYDSRGITGSGSLPCGLTFFTQFQMLRPIHWQGCGMMQTRLVQILGSPGLSQAGSPASAILPQFEFPGSDDYQQSINGLPLPSYEKLSLWSQYIGTTAYIGNTGLQTVGSGGFIATNPPSNRARSVPITLTDFEVVNFPGSCIGGYAYDGAFIASNLIVDGCGVDGVHLDFVDQPSSFKTLIVRNAVNDGIYLNKPADAVFSARTELFNNGIGIQIAGYSAPGKVIAFDELHCTDSQFQCLDDNGTNVSIHLHAARFFGNNCNGCSTAAATGPADSDISIGPLAGSNNSSTSGPSIITVDTQWDSITTDNTVWFYPDASNNYCLCYVDLGGSYVGSNGKAITPTVQNQPFVHGWDALNAIVMNALPLSFGTDITSASPALCLAGNGTSINAVGADCGTDWNNFGAGGFNVRQGATLFVTIQAPTLGAGYHFNLPNGAGVIGQPLVSGGGGSTPMTNGYPQVAIASLPTCNSGEEGAWYELTNAVASPVYGAVPSTTGSTHWPVFCNGSAWGYH